MMGEGLTKYVNDTISITLCIQKLVNKGQGGDTIFIALCIQKLVNEGQGGEFKNPQNPVNVI